MRHDLLNAQSGSFFKFSACLLGRWLGLVIVVAVMIAGFPVRAQDGSNLIGASRGDVIRTFGEPENTLRKGDIDMLIYPNGIRIEIQDDVVINYRGSVGQGIISRGGTEYTAGEDGNVHKAEPAKIELVAPVAEATAETEVPDPEPSAESSPEPWIETTAAPEEVIAADSDRDEIAAETNGPMAKEEMDPDHIYDDASAQAEHYLEGFGAVKNPEPPPPAVTAFQAGLQVVARFAFALLILWITLRWLGRPFYFPDLIKVSLLYTAVRAAIHGLGTLGGSWQFINIFEVPDIVAFFSLAILLFKFGVTKDGLTALKIAGATIAVTYFLMIGLGIVLVFGLGSAI